MYILKLCETQDYSPRILEHCLHNLQKEEEEMQLTFIEHKGKVALLCSEDLSPHFKGSKSIKCKDLELKGAFHLKQSKGCLLPIKRHAQFEDRVNKTRIYPSDGLIKNMVNNPGSFVQIRFKAIKENKRNHALKKAKRTHFQSERYFDQWETYGWFNWSLRRFFGPILRRALSPFKLQKMHDEQTESQHEREDPRRATLDKLSRPLFRVRVEMSHPFQNFIQGFTLPYLGGLSIGKQASDMIFSAEELASLASFPDTQESASYLYTETTAYLTPPHTLYFNEEDRKRHLYFLGKTGMGKSSALLNLFEHDLKKDRCIVLIDPHGDLTEDAIKLIPESRHKDIILLDPSQTDHPIALNPVEHKVHEIPSLKASNLIEMFQTLAQGSWGPRLEYILRNLLLSLILAPNTTLLDVPRFLTEEVFARKVLKRVHDPELHRFWENEFFKLDKRTRQEHCAPILNKVGPLITSPLLRNIFGQPRGKVHFEKYLDERKIILITLSKGQLGEDASRLLGMIFISMIQSVLLKRSKQKERRTVALSIDEFQNFKTSTLTSMLSESRKYGLALTLANQYLTQLTPEIQDAVLGNIGSLFVFRSSWQDACILAPSLGLQEKDLTQLAPFQAYARVLNQNKLLPLFRWQVSSPFKNKDREQKETGDEIDLIQSLKNRSFERFGRRRQLVEEKLKMKYNKATRHSKNETNSQPRPDP